MEAGRAWRRASRGGTKAALNLNPIAVPASSSPPPNITGTRPDGKRRRHDNDFDLVLPVRISQDCQPPRPHPSTAAESAFSLLPLGRGIRRGPVARRAGPFSLCPSEAKSLAVLPTRLGWVTANLCRPSASGRMRYLVTWRRPPRGAVPCFRTERREAWLQLGGAMFPYGEAGEEAPCPAERGPVGGGSAPGSARPTQGGVMFPFGKVGDDAGSSPQGARARAGGRRGTRGGGGAASGK